MDPFSGEGELLTIHNAFHLGQYTNVLDFDTSSLSSTNQTAARILQLRARIATGDTESVLSELDGESSPDLAAVKVLAQYTTGDTDGALQDAEQLAESAPEEPTVQVLCSLVLHICGKSEEALALLSKHSGNLEAVLLTTQIHLSRHSLPLASSTITTAKRWAQDSLLFNLAEAYLNLALGSSEKYQSAFYVFEELASAPSTSSVKTLTSQAIAELHLGRVPEAEAALTEALERASRATAKEEEADVLANLAVLKTVAGKMGEAEEYLRRVDREHALVRDLEEKSSFFDDAKGKFAAKVAS